MRISGIWGCAAALALASVAAHADDFGTRDNGAPAQFVQHAPGQQWDHRDDSHENRGEQHEQHAQTHRDDRHEHERAAHGREERHRDDHAHEHRDQRQDSGSVFDSRRSDYRS